MTWDWRDSKGEEVGRWPFLTAELNQVHKELWGWNWDGRSTKQSWDRSGVLCRSGCEIHIAVIAAVLKVWAVPELLCCWKAVVFSSHGLVLRWRTSTSLSASHWTPQKNISYFSCYSAPDKPLQVTDEQVCIVLVCNSEAHEYLQYNICPYFPFFHIGWSQADITGIAETVVLNTWTMGRFVWECETSAAQVSTWLYVVFITSFTLPAATDRS